MEILSKISKEKKRNIVGLMSGTSVDGVDACLVQISGSGDKTEYEIIEHHREKYPDLLRAKLLEVSEGNKVCVDDICKLNFAVGEVFAKSANEVIKISANKIKSVHAIASHGQTIWHAPEADNKSSTLQIGDISVISARTGVVTIGDFRTADIAAGGQGAPLVPFAHWVLFGKQNKSLAVNNIGGISNATIIPAGSNAQDVYAFDTGPGNIIIDSIIQNESTNSDLFDRDGLIAQSGKVNIGVVNNLMNMDFLNQLPPKTAGRHLFAKIRELIPADLSLEDRVATATAFTALSIFKAYEKFVLPNTPLEKIILTGGGANNNSLFKFLSDYFSPIKVEKIDEYKIPCEVTECLAFAILANETLMGNTSSCIKATGAIKSAILGKISIP